MPAKEAESVSSAVAEERTATAFCWSACGQPVVGLADSLGEPFGHRLLLDHRPNLDRRALQRGGVIYVDLGKALLDPFAQAA